MRKKRVTPVLPVRAGISPNSVYLPAPDPSGPGWSSVLQFLAARFPAIAADRWRERMLRGDVFDAQGQPIPPDSPYRPGTRLYYYRELETELPVPFPHKILHEDEHLLVADKPHFLPTVPSGSYLHETLISRLRHEWGQGDLEVLHRLDRDTAGLVLIAKHPGARDAYHRLFRERRVEKVYLAMAPLNSALEFPLTRASHIGSAADFYRRQEGAGEVNAITRIELAQQIDGLGLYRLYPVTGKTHQLRIHMAALGMPILNDPYYPRETPREPGDFSQPLQLLAQALTFADPFTGAERRFTSTFSLAPV
ncbi:MAG: pseudouridine synthase [Gammaproteobacteria bacterium]|nr:pseudouridine synthase [Gammaproteobacteria bacterium]